jgi:hypothetical protein
MEPWWEVLGVRSLASLTTIDAAFVREVLRYPTDNKERLLELAQALRQARKARQ